MLQTPLIEAVEYNMTAGMKVSVDISSSQCCSERLTLFPFFQSLCFPKLIISWLREI